MNFKRISALFAALLAVGCGTNPAFTTLNNNSNSFQAYADGTGRYRTFSFDYARAEKQNARQVYPNLPVRRELPGKVDLRATCSEIGDQGKLGSCTAWAMGDGLREFLINKSGTKLTQLSPLFFYYKEREIMGTIDEDSGATITDGMTVLKETGIAPEADWPYVIEKFNLAPPAVAEENANKFKVSKTIPIRGLDQVKNQLAGGYPVAFGFRVYKSFMGKDVAATGVMPMPKPGEQMMGGHAVLAVGYDDEKKVLIVRNSWGTKWGDKGYFYMPYDNMKWSMDFWTAQ